jgi:hypothetical protein
VGVEEELVGHKNLISDALLAVQLQCQQLMMPAV